MGNHLFLERLNRELDEIGLPKYYNDRTTALAKMLRLPHFKAEALLSGSIRDEKSLEKLAHELEVTIDWLTGKDDAKKAE